MPTSEPSPNRSAALSVGAIKRELTKSLSPLVSVHLHDSVDSTNSCLLQSHSKTAFEICATELQTSGRGRRGKAWRTPEQGVTFSMKLTVPVPLTEIGGASLVCGVAVCESFRQQGIARAAVKWPNDILVGGAKLAGILVEIAAHDENHTTLVVGIGINYRSGLERESIDREIIDLYQLFDGDVPDRSRLIGKICNHVCTSLAGALPLQLSFIDAWDEFDALANQPVTVLQAIGGGSGTESRAASVAGRAAGIDKRGYLILQTDSGPRFFSSAEVTIQKPTQLLD